jgi:hypothetical protein
MKYEFVCVWCGKKKSDPYSVCNAPDGDGHLFDRREAKERKITTTNSKSAQCKSIGFGQVSNLKNGSYGCANVI